MKIYVPAETQVIFKILLADDDPDDRMIFENAFQDIPMKTIVSTVKDGVELMEYLHQEEELPHILFLDLNMPKKNGLQSLKEIRCSEKLRNLPVVIYSTSSSPLDVETTFVAGANFYIKKPTNFGSLKRILSEVMLINWQHESSGFNKEMYMCNLS